MDVKYDGWAIKDAENVNIPNKGSLVLFNSGISEPQKYYNSQSKPLDAIILEAYFSRPEDYEQYASVEGIYNFMLTGTYDKIFSKQSELLSKKDFSLNIIAREITDEGNLGRVHTMKFNNYNAIMDILGDNPARDKIKGSSWHAQDYEAKDSCMPLLNTPILIYLQSVNGHDVYAISKSYSFLNLAGKNTETSNAEQKSSKKKK